jgi:predicted lipid-binding transport protein (Tim44 family)
MAQMRDFFIRGLEIVINVVVVLMAVVIVLAAGTATFAPAQAASQLGGMSGPLAGIGILVAGFLYLIFVAGFMYLGLGIYQNTKKTAELLAQRQL